MTDPDLEAVVAAELRLLEPAVRDDPQQVRALLHPDFREHGASGTVWDRATVTAATAGTPETIGASDVVAHRLGPGTVLVTYRSDASGRRALRSSVWVREGDRWLLRFHQGTPVPTPLHQPRLTGEGLLLRPFAASDAPLVVEAAGDPLVPLISTVPAEPDDDAVRAFLDRQVGRAAGGTGWSWAVADEGSDRALGQVGLWPLGGGRASVGYWVAPSARGAGVVRRALVVVAAWAWTRPDLARLELYVEPENEASWRSAEAAGWVREGLLRSWQEVGGVRRDMWSYSLLRPDGAPARTAAP